MEATNLAQVYAATDGGLDIIKSVCPQVADVVGTNRNFRLRPGERTPSAHLYPPDSRCDYWQVVDYGGGEGERWFTPIDLYMRDRGYAQSQFSLALNELMEQYGVGEHLNPRVNKPDITQREATPDEIGQPPQLTLREGFTRSELATWGPRVKAEHLTELGWASVSMVQITKGKKTTIKRSTDTYPIFAQTCEYTVESGNLAQFQKIYEPKCFRKEYRFFTIGNVPNDYIYGLSALRRRFVERGEEKLDEVVIVSGGSDAVNCLSQGFQPVWLNSETAGLREDTLKLLQKYAKRVILIPDIDATGIKTAQRLALRFPTLYIAWLTPEDMGGLHDNRGRQRKDLKDFIQLHPRQEDMKRLIERARCSLYWIKSEDKNGHTHYAILPARLNYYLSLNGFYTLKDDSRKEPIYIHVDGVKVERVVAKTISNFLIRQAEQDGLPEGLQNKLNRSRDLPTNQISHLTQRDDLDFTKCTADSQDFYFKNGWVRVTADEIRFYRYSDINGTYVWADSIIPHDYRAMPPMFHVEKTDDGSAVVIDQKPQSKFFQFVINTSRLYWRKQDEQGLELSEGEEAEEYQCLVSKMACIGYMLFGHKSESEAWAPICQDSKLAESPEECNGGSGKSLFLKSVGSLLNFFRIEANTPSITENRFLFDGVTEDTDLVIVDECCMKLNYDFFFGRVTGDLKGEEKGNHPYIIPFSKSPKFAFATNYVLKKHDASTERRIWPQVFSDYYHEKTPKNDYRESRTVRDDLGCNLMGTEYSEDDWQADIAFMLQCVQFYLSLPKGQRRIMPPLSRIEQREQMAAVGKDFKEWADDYFAEGGGKLDRELKADSVLNDFNNETKFGWSAKKMTQRLTEYCQLADHIHCLNPASITGKDKDGERWVKRDENQQQKSYYYVQSVKGAAKSTGQEPVEQKLDF